MGTGTVALAVINGADMPVCEMCEMAIAYAVFGDPQLDLAVPWYDLRLCAVSPPAPGISPGFSVNTKYDLDDLVAADTVIVPSVPPGVADHGDPLPPELIEALRAAHARGSRMVSLCTGAFALAAAGLLDGRRASAHWMNTDGLMERYPEIQVDNSVLYVDDGDVLTSAGMSAGLDLCLHLVRRDLGAYVANQLARRMVTSAHRAGGQSQFVDLSVPPTDDDSLGPVMDWATENLGLPITVDDLARRAGMSSRTFFRRLQASTGLTPLKWLLHQRLARAQALLETTDLPIERISEDSGFGSGANLRKHFTTHVGVTPTGYRQAFSLTPGVRYGRPPRVS